MSKYIEFKIKVNNGDENQMFQRISINKEEILAAWEQNNLETEIFLKSSMPRMIERHATVYLSYDEVMKKIIEE